jgi:hypothetical protein
MQQCCHQLHDYLVIKPSMAALCLTHCPHELYSSRITSILVWCVCWGLQLEVCMSWLAHMSCCAPCMLLLAGTHVKKLVGASDLSQFFKLLEQQQQQQPDAAEEQQSRQLPASQQQQQQPGQQQWQQQRHEKGSRGSGGDPALRSRL